MQKITAIRVQKNNPKRVNIYLDGDFAFGLSRIVAGWLTVGQVIDEERINQLQVEDARERALQQALLFLSYRDRSEAEIRTNLKKHKFPEPVIEATLERLRRDRFVDDTKFAHTWVENRITFRPRGRRALALELRQKGIDSTTIESVLENVDDADLAYKAGSKKAPKLQALEWSEFRKKLSDFLARRGFSYSDISPTVSRLWTSTHPEEESINNHKEIT